MRISLFSWVCGSDCHLRSWLSYNLYVYLFIGTLVKTKIPATTGIYLRYETKQGRWELTTPVIPVWRWHGSKSTSTALSSDTKSYEGRSWTNCSTRRFVMAFRRFGTPISEVDSANYQFDSSAGLLCRFVVSSCRFIVSLSGFVVSTRPLREANI